MDDSYDSLIFAVSAGMYLYIVLGTLIPEVREQFTELLRTDMLQAFVTTILQVAGIFAGLALMFIMNVHNDEIWFNVHIVVYLFFLLCLLYNKLLVTVQIKYKLIEVKNKVENTCTHCLRKFKSLREKLISCIVVNSKLTNRLAFFLLFLSFRH